ncbi:MAG: hypothetical protein J6A89_04245 [Clostridia bacterium]|nr:hypothetical protein [Clostridia bacterium]
MSKKSDREEELISKIDIINKYIMKNNFIELSEILGNTKKMLLRNFFSGISKGIGIGIGFTILTAILVYFLQRLVRLNIPVIGEYITDIVDIVEKNK